MKKALHTFITQTSNLNKILFLLIALSFVQIGKGQSTANYSFTTGTTGSMALDSNSNAIDMSTGTTQLVGPAVDNSISIVTNIGFDFYLMGLKYSQFSASSDGFVYLGSAAGSGTTFTGASTTTPKIAAMGGDLYVGATTGKVHYKLVGTAPYRCLVVEFKDMAVYYSTSNTTNVFQVRLYETTGLIEFMYGNMYCGSTTYSPGYVGFATTYGSANNQVSITTSTNTSTTNATFASNAYTATTNIANLYSAADGSRRYYRYRPLTPAAPTSLTFSGVSGTGMTLNWTAASPTTNVLKYAIYSSTDGTNYSYVNTVNVGTNTYAVTGLSFGTTYYWKVYSLSEGGLSTALSNSQATSAGTISGNKTIPGSYASLTAAFADINLNGLAGNVNLVLQSGYVSTVETFPLAGPSAAPMGSYTATIYPAVTGLSITSANTTGTINLNGSKNIIFDGRVGGAGSTKDLVIANTNQGTSYAINFVNDANTNTFKYCKINSRNNSTSSGTVYFGLTTGANGNDNNTIDNCDIYDGSSTPFNAIYSLGTATSTATNNSSNTISNCNIYNFSNLGGIANGIYLSTGNTDWTINANNFYQTATRTKTGAATDYGINISNTGNNYIITNNNIGGGAASCGGTAWTVAGAFGNRFVGINLTVGTTTATSVQNNTIANYIWSSTSGANAVPGVWAGIYLVSGNANIGTITGNTIGSGTGNGSIAITSTTTGAVSTAICAASTGTFSINKNIIGSINVLGNAVGKSSSFNGIWNSGAATSANIDNNTIGSTSTTNSINASNAATGTTAAVVQGIVNSGVCSAISITNNVISYLNSAYVPTALNAANVLTGINSSNGANTITGNTVKNLTTAAYATGTTSAASIIGISMTSSTTGTTLSQNTIFGLSNTYSAGTTATSVIGIYYSGTTGTNLVARNLIHSLSLSNTVASNIYGIYINAGTTTYKNNIIRLGLDAAGSSITLGHNINGIFETAGTNNIYFNSIFIGGTAVSGTTATYAFNSTVTTNTRIFQNNIFYNARSNGAGTGKHYAVKVGGTAANPAGLTINYNDYLANGTGGVFGFFNSLDVANIGAWRTAVGQDANSINADPLFVAQTAVTPDLHLTTGSPCEATGLLVAAITDDFDGQTRASFTPTDIGADAGDYAPIGVEMSPTAITAPAVSGCYSATESVTVTIRNNSAAIIDFSVNPVTVAVTGANAASGYTSNNIVNTGTLAASATTNITMPVTINMTASGTYSFNATTSVTGDINTGNDALATVSRTVNALGSTYTVGSGGNYATITEAVAAYNNATCLTGPVVFSLTDATYSGETLPITINAHSQASGTNTLTIKPASGVNATISGTSATSIFKLNGADYVTIDGSNNGTSSRNLTISNANTGTSSAVVWICSVLSPANGATNNTVKNVIITGNAPATSLAGIAISGSTINTAAEAQNSNNTVSNNLITAAQIGVLVYGITTTNDASNTISDNTIGSATAASKMGLQGIYIANQQGVSISGNTILGVNSSSNINTAGIYVGIGISAGNISKNIISDIKNTIAAGRQSFGIWLNSSTATTGLTISNNIIYDVANSGGNAVLSRGCHGIAIITGGGYNIYYNTVNMNTNPTGATGKNAAIYIALGVTTLDIRNNIFANNQSTGTAYAIYSDAANTAYSSINYNNYSSVGTLGFLTSARILLSDIVTGFGGNANSTAIAPVFTSATDMHLSTSANGTLNNTGTYIAAVTTDIDGDTRSGTTPDMGADEFTVVVCASADGGTSNATLTSICTSGSATLSSTGYSTGVGSTYEWEKSTDNFATAGVSMGAATSVYATMATGTITQTMYYRLKVICSAGSPAYSSVVTVNVYTPATLTLTSNTSICAGSGVALTVSGSSTYAWSPAGTLSAATGSSVTATPATTTTYTVTGTDSHSCTSTASVTITVNPVPSAVTVSQSPTSVCAGAVATLTASGGTIPANGSAKIGLGVLTSSSSSYLGSAYPSFYGNGRQQYIILASELTTAGITASTFSSMTFKVIATGNPSTLSGYTLKLASTAASSLSAFLSPTFTTVYGPTDYTPIVGDNTHNFSSNFTWDGSSNILVELCFGVGTSGTSSATMEYSTTSTTLCVYNYSDGATICGTASTLTTTSRPNITIGYTSSTNAPITWSPSTDLYTNIGATTPYSGGSATVVYAKNNTSTSYTATATNGSCTATKNINTSINALPTLSTSDATICNGNSTPLSVSGATSYSWSPATGLSATNVASVTANPSSTQVYTITGTDGNNCTNTVTSTVTVNPVISITGQPNNVVALENTDAQFSVTVTGVGLGYQWQINTGSGFGNILGATSASYTETAVTSGMSGYSYQCIVTGTACSSVTSNVATLTISTTSITLQPASTSICSNQSATFTISTSGTTPTYQWQISTNGGSSWSDISGKTDTTLTVSGLTSANSLTKYRCQLNGGAINSDPATLSVYDAVSIGTQPTDQSTCSNSASVAFSVSATGSGLTYQWQVSTNGGVDWASASGSSTSDTYTITSPSVSLNQYKYRVIVSGTSPCSSVTSDPVTLTVIGVSSVSSLSGSNACVSTPFDLTVTPTTGSPTLSYSWASTAGSGAATPVTTNPATITPTVANSYTYTLTATGGGCTLSDAKNITVNSLPAITTNTAAPATVCSGATINLTAASVGIASGSAALGAGGSTSSSSGSSFLPGSWGGAKTQYIIKASELTGMGLSAGNITAIGFEPTTSGQTYTGFSINIGATAQSVATTTFISSGLTQVYLGTVGANNGFTPSSGVLNTFTFGTGSGSASSFNWDGSSNIVVSISWSSVPNAATSTYSTMKVDASGFTCTSYRQADSETPATMLASTTATGTGSNRPKFTITGQISTNITASYNWSWNSTPAVNSATGTTTITNTSGSPVTPTFTVTATNASTGCINTATTSAVTVNTATVAPTANNSSQCGVQTPTCSVTGTGNVGNTFKWYTVAVAGTALSGQTASTLSSYSVSTTTTFYVSEVTSGGCESPRTAVTVTVNTPPTITVSATNTTVCGGTTTTLSVSSSNSDYTYTWSNSLGTGPSVIATPIAATTYYVTASDNSGNGFTGCAVIDNIAIAFTPASVGGTATATVSTMCQTGSSSLTVAGYTGSIQWEQSADNSTWGNVSSGGTAATYATGTITQTTYYRAKITNSSCAAAYSNVLTITVNNPQVLTTTPNSRCGTGTVTLGATASEGTLNWYAASTGGTSLGTGTTFTTPSISSNTTYYVGAEAGSNVTSTIGSGSSLTTATTQPTAFCNRFASYHHQYIYTAAELITAGFSAGYIQSMGYNITSLGDAASNATFTVKIGNTALNTYTDFVNSGLSTVYGPSTYTHTSSGLQTITFATPFYWDGSSNILVDVTMSGADNLNNSITYYTTTASAMGGNSYNGTATATPTTSRLNTTFTIQPCSSSRTSVLATVNSVPTATFTASPSATSCSNTAVTYTTQSGQSNYSWSVPGVAETDYHITAGGISATDNSVSLTWLTAGSKTVTVNYTNSSGCYSASVATNTITAYVTPVPSFTVEPSANVCKNNDVTYTTQASFSNYIWTLDGVAETDYHIVSGGIGTGSNTVTLRWLTIGSKTVTVNYSSGVCQGVSAASNTTTSNESPVPTFTASSASSVCTGSDIIFTTQGSKTAYNWVIPGTVDVDYTITAGGISATDNTVTLKWITTGSKVVTVNYSEFGCPGGDAASSSATAYSFPSPTFTTSPGASVCASSNVTYATQTLQSNYVWSVPGTVDVDYTIVSGSIGATSSTVTLSWITAGSKEVTVNYDNMCGSGGVAASSTTTVNARPTPTYTTSPGANVCLNTDITYTTQAGESSYVWSVPGTVSVNYSITSGGISATDNTVTLKWLTAGSKNVTVNYSDANTCTGSGAASNTTTVEALTTATYTASPSATICANTDVTYTTQSGSGQTNYTWSVPGTQDVDYSITSGGIGTGSSTVTLKWLTVGSKTVTVSYLTANSCLSSTATNTTSVSSLSGTVTVGSGGTYTTLTGANGLFSAINNCGLSGNLTANIISDITETGANALNQWSGGWTLNIQPNGGVARTLTGSIAGPLIDLNGADKVTIDGLNTGGNSLTIINTNTAGTAGTSTIRFIADATNNVIQNCTLKGSGTGAPYTSTLTTAVVLFATGTTTGNDNNQLLNNNITSYSTTYATQLVASYGTSVAISNDNITITGNNLYDFFSTAGMAAINVGLNSSAWNISTNKIYQTISATTLASANYLKAIVINTASGSGYTVNSNVIGYNSSAASAVMTNSGGRFTGIEFTAVASAPVSEIQGNTINGINWTSASGASSLGTALFNGIYVAAGGVNIGTTSGNTIGATSGTGTTTSNIYLVGPTGAGYYPIYVTSATACTVSNNNIGAINVVPSAAGATIAFTGVSMAGTGSHIVNGNNIGNSTTAGIALGVVATSTGVATVKGIEVTATGAITVGSSGNGNTIQNININAVATNAFTGILNTGAGSTLNINYNTIKGIVFGATGTAHGSTFKGISSTGAVTTTVNINNNNLGTATVNLVDYKLTATAASGALTGIEVTNSTSATTHSIQNNDIRGIVYASAGSGSHTYINLTGATAASDVATIAGNTFTNLNVNTSGNVVFISHSYIIAATSQCIINNNSIVTGFTKASAGGTNYLTYTNASSVTGAINNYTNNNFSNITLTGATSLIGFYNNDGGTASTKTISGNNLSSWTSGAGTLTGMTFNYWNGVSSLDHNTISSISCQSTIIGISLGSTVNTATSIAVNDNTITGLSSTGTGGAVTAITCGNTSSIINIYSNIINTLSSASTTATVAGISITAATTTNVYSNTINTLSCVGTTSGVTNGIMVSLGTNVNIYKNKIYDLTTSGAFTTAPGVNGIYISAGTTVNTNNNIIGDLKAPAANSTDAIRGISITSTTATTNYNVYYNTVYLNATSTGTNFGVTGLYHAASSTGTTAKLDLRNNVIVNNSTYKGTGLVVAFRRSAGGASTLANYASTSNNNLFYAGTPSAINLIYSDGTSTAQTIAQFSAGTFTAGTITPRDASDVTENPTWLSTAGSNSNYLHVDPTTLTVIESGGANIATYTSDYDGDVRQGNPGYPSQVNGGGTAPDLGADEFDGKPAYTCVSPTPGNTVASATSLCGGQSVNLSLQNATSGTGVTYQWKSSTDGITYNDVNGATTSTLTTTPPASTYYECVVTCANGPSSATSTPIQVTYPNSITSTTPASRCGTGTVNLGATATGGTLNWYAAATGGTALGTGSPWTTPSISTTTTYYVGAETTISSSGSATIGAGASTSATYSNPFYSAWSNNHTQHLIPAAELTAAGLTAGNLTSVALNVTSAGSLPMIDLSVKIGATSAVNMSSFVANGTFTTVYTNASLLPTTGVNVLTFATPFLWDGTSNIIIEFCHGNGSSTTTMSRTVKTDATSYVSSINSVVWSATNSATVCGNSSSNSSTYSVRPQFIFAGQMPTNCSSPRTAVIATVITAPAITITPSPASICIGSSSSIAVSSDNTNYTYSWSNSQTGTPNVVSPSTTTTYTVTASDNSGGANDGCVVVGSTNITVNPLPTSVTASASASTICNGTSVDLTSSAVTSTTTTFISESGDGGFETGGSFALNNWTAVNGLYNNWYVGTSAGTQAGTNAAFVGTGFVGTGNASVNHFYRDITIPAGYTNISLKFYLKMPTTDVGYDSINVYTTTTSNTPVAGTAPASGYARVFANSASAYSNYTLQAVPLSNALAGTTVRLVFTYRCDGVADYGVPAIDNILLTGDLTSSHTYAWTSLPAGYTSTSQNPTGVSPTETTEYIVVATNGYGCTASNNTSITVRAAFSGGTLTSASQTICNGAQPVDITYSASPSGGSLVQYQWYKIAGAPASPSGAFAIGSWTAIGGTSLSAPVLAGTTIGNLTTAYSYALRATDIGTPACFDNWAGNVHAVNVNAIPTAGSIASAQVICSGSTPATLTSEADGTGTGTVAYEWQTNASGSYVTIGSEIASTYAPPSLTGTTSYQRRTAATGGGTTCYSDYSSPIQVSVNTAPTSPDSISGSSIACSGAKVTLTAAGGSVGDGAVYEWGTGDVVGSNIIGGATSSSYLTPTLSSNSKYWTRLVGTTGCTNTTSGVTKTITINLPSNIAGLTTGDYVWAGYTNTNWNTLENWLVFNSTANPVYSTPATVPTLSDKVFILNDDLACGFQSSASVSTGTANCNNITIDAGRTLILNNGETLDVTGNWSNSGTFTAGTNSTVVFIGTSQQTVVTNGSVFNKLTVNNSNGLLLNSNLNVTNALTMTTGNITMGLYTLELGQDALNPGTLNYVSGSVQGKMKRWYAQSTNSGNTGLFPIGVGSDYRPLLVEFTDAPVGGGNLSVQFKEVAMGWQNSGNSPTISALNGCDEFLVTSYSSIGYWEVNPTGAGMSNATYNITLVGGGFTGVNTLCKTTAVKRVGSGLWTTSGTHVPPTGSLTSPIVQRVGAMGWSNWGIAGGGNNLLPIELLSFNAECYKTAVNISWSTASETNNKSFSVEKSYNGDQWSSIAELLGAGNSNHLINYHYLDINSSGITYYRLKQTDFDGAYTYSEAIAVNCESSNNNQVIVYPNPFKNSISINGLQEVASTFEITDVMGKIVYKDFRVASYTESINLNSLTPGLYTLIIIDKNGNSRQFKIVKN
ncbi:MAG: T9SS type A sorting domain-containing protein [Bacteroidota bacterium]